MRYLNSSVVLLLLLSCGACSRRDDGFATQTERDNAARKVGRAAYELSKETKKAARKAGEELRDASHEAHQGWKEAKQDDKLKRTAR